MPSIMEHLLNFNWQSFVFQTISQNYTGNLKNRMTLRFQFFEKSASEIYPVLMYNSPEKTGKTYITLNFFRYSKGGIPTILINVFRNDLGSE